MLLSLRRSCMNEMKGETTRTIPFDQPAKIVLLLLHAVGFSGWFGGAITSGTVSGLFPGLTTISGVLLGVRELYKDGLRWLYVVEGSLTITKVVLLVVAVLKPGLAPILLGAVLTCGVLSSHLPKGIRENPVGYWGGLRNAR
jgi:hypothetical protein